jgi:hypothetical protein
MRLTRIGISSVKAHLTIPNTIFFILMKRKPTTEFRPSSLSSATPPSTKERPTLAAEEKEELT